MDHTTMIIHKDTGVSEGLTVEDLVTDPDVLDGQFPVLDFDTIDVSAPSPGIGDSDIQQLGFRIVDQDGNDLTQVQSEPAKLFLINGKLPTGVTLEAGNAAWASGGTDPAGALMPGDWFPGNALDITGFGGFGAQAGQGYGYANLLIAANGLTADVAQADTIGYTNWPMCMIEYPYLDVLDDGQLGIDDNRKITPGKFAWIFVVIPNRNGTGQCLQVLGCSDRMPELTDTLTVNDTLKGGKRFAQSVSENHSLISANTLSHTKWVYENIFNRGAVAGTGMTGYKRKDNVNLREYRVIIRQETSTGHAIWHDMKANIYNDGTHGQSGGDGLIPFTIAPINDIYWHTDYPMDYEWFVIKYAIDATA